MADPIVIGRPTTSGAIPRWLGICVEVEAAKRDGAALKNEIDKVDNLAAQAAELLRDALFEIGYIRTEVQQGSLFK